MLMDAKKRPKFEDEKDPMVKRETLELVRAYYRIPDPAVRKRLVTSYGSGLIEVRPIDLALSTPVGYYDCADVWGDASMRRVKPSDLKEVRGALQMTQAEFANAFGLSLRTYQKWESGEKSPSGPATMFMRLVIKDPHGILKALSDS